MLKRFSFFSIVAVVLASSIVVLSGCSDTVETNSMTVDSPVDSVSEFVKTDVAVGHGKEATKGKTVFVHYTGWLYDESAPDHKGQKFDSSRDRGAAFEFPLGAGRVIKGWDQGVAGMKVGGKRTLIIPPNLGYGATGAGRIIPPNAVLLFDVELLDVR